jgi:hypothetical protein
MKIPLLEQLLKKHEMILYDPSSLSRPLKNSPFFVAI